MTFFRSMWGKCLNSHRSCTLIKPVNMNSTAHMIHDPVPVSLTHHGRCHVGYLHLQLQHPVASCLPSSCSISCSLYGRRAQGVPMGHGRSRPLERTVNPSERVAVASQKWARAAQAAARLHCTHPAWLAAVDEVTEPVTLLGLYDRA